MIASTASWISLIIFHGLHNPILFLFLAFIFTALFQYIEFHLMGKKLAISLMVILFMSPSTLPVVTPLYYLEDVLIGVLCAIVGTVFPYPVFACRELELQAQESSKVKIFTYLLISDLYF